jgi:hypothetical protein
LVLSTTKRWCVPEPILSVPSLASTSKVSKRPPLWAYEEGERESRKWVVWVDTCWPSAGGVAGFEPHPPFLRL